MPRFGCPSVVVGYESNPLNIDESFDVCKADDGGGCGCGFSGAGGYGIYPGATGGSGRMKSIPAIPQE